MLSGRPEHRSCIRASFHFIFSFVLFGKHTHSKNHVLSSHSVVSSVFQRTRQFKSFSESKQIYWSIATANTFILVFGNILNIFAAFFKELALITIREMWGLGLELSGLILGLEVSARSRYRKLRSRLHHWCRLVNKGLYGVGKHVGTDCRFHEFGICCSWLSWSWCRELWIILHTAKSIHSWHALTFTACVDVKCSKLQPYKFQISHR